MTRFASHSSHDSLTCAKAAELCPLVEQTARKLLRRLPKSVSLDDLIGAGNLGLVHALSKFDPDDSEWFDGYALQRARGAMLDELRKLDPLGRFERRKINHVHKVERDLAQELGRKPTSAEVQQAAGLSKSSFNRAREHAKCSFAEPLDTTGADSDLSADSGAPWNVEDRAIAAGEARRALERLDALPERLRRVMTMYYLEDRTLREIGAHLGVTEPRVHQLRVEALAKLRHTYPAYATATARSKSSRRRPARRAAAVGRERVSILPRSASRCGSPVAANTQQAA